MNKDHICRSLEGSFVSSLMKELIPGVLHNFANPLGGIMGRSKLLKKRLDETTGKMRHRCPDIADEMHADIAKIKADVDAINTESDKFYTMFHDLAWKFYALSSPEPGMFNLSSLIEHEVRFADFYLDFKHDVAKEVSLDDNLPELPGSMAEYSLCISTLIRHSLIAMRSSPVKKFFIGTSHDEKNVFLDVRYTGSAISEEHRIVLEEGLLPPSCPESIKDLLNVFSILKTHGACLNVLCQDGSNIVSVMIPCNGYKKPEGC